MFARGKTGLATGIDNIADEVMMKFPVQTAKFYHALAVKIGIRISEPYGFKGGEMAKIYKGARCRSDVKNSRGVLLSSTVGKKIHKAYERRAMRVLTSYSLESQCGGIGGKGTDFAAHGLRLAQKYAQHSRKSAMFIFYDLVAAFHKVLRQLLFGSGPWDEDLARVMAELDMPEDAMHELYQVLTNSSVMKEAGVDDHLRDIMEEAHCDTWFTIDGSEHPTRTKTGSRPGNPWGSTVFNFFCAWVLRRMNQRLLHEDLLEKVPYSGERSIMGGANNSHSVALDGFSFVDDLVHAAMDEASRVQKKGERIAAIALDTFSLVGHEANCKPKKTAVVVNFSGKHARQLIQDMWRSGVPCIVAATQFTSERHITLAKCYKHVGGQFPGNGSMAPEVTARNNDAIGAMKSLSKPIFRNKNYSRSVRAQLAKTFVQSKQLYNAATWMKLNIGEKKRMETAAMKVNRAIADEEHAEGRQHIADIEVRHMTDSLSIDDTMTKMRTKYLTRLCEKGPDILFALLQQTSSMKDSWSNMIQQDCHKVWTTMPTRDRLPYPTQHWNAWEDILMNDPCKRNNFSDKPKPSGGRYKRETLGLRGSQETSGSN